MFLTGGNHSRLSRGGRGTRLGDAIHRAHDRGAVLAGTSAGRRDGLAHGGVRPDGQTPEEPDGAARGRVGTPAGGGDRSALRAAGRIGRLLTVVAHSPSLLGIGHGRGHVRRRQRGQVMQVLGRGAVTRRRRLRTSRPMPRGKGYRPIMVSGAIAALVARRVLVRSARPSVDRGPTRARARGLRVTLRRRRVGRTREGRGDDPAARAPRPTAGACSRSRPATSPRSEARPEASSQTQVFRGPNYWSYDPCIRMLVDLGVARGVAVEHDPRVQRRAAGAAPGRRRALVLPRQARAASASGSIDGHLARSRRRARRARAPARVRGAHLARQDAERRRAGPLQRDLRVLGGARRRRGRHSWRSGS